MISGFHGAIAALVTAGNNVIVDHMLQEAAWGRECAALLAPFRAILVGVHCPLVELERREAARTDRSIGLAKFQWARVHAHQLYDLEVDTSTQRPEECAGHISTYLRAGQVPTAFRRPAVVISPSSYDRRVGLALCCPVTSQVKGYPFEVLLARAKGEAHRQAAG